MFRFLSGQQCLKYLQYWSTVCHGLGAISVRPGAVFVQSLMRALYGALSHNLRSEFVRSLSNPQTEIVVCALDNVYCDIREYLPIRNQTPANALLYSNAVLNNSISANRYLMVS